MNVSVHFNRIQQIKTDLGYSNDRKFAKDIGKSYVTFLKSRDTEKCSIEFLNWVNALLVRNGKKPKKNSFFIKEFDEL